MRRIENYKTPNGNTYTQWLCKCDCGSEPRGVLTNALTSGRSLSCGCYGSEIRADFCKEKFSTHNESKTRLYRIWTGIKKRCCNKSSYNYKDYGGRGICICTQWNKFEIFRDWAMANGYQNNLSIDRIDVNGNYEPNNCRWVTRIVQANNRRSNRLFEIDGVVHTLAEWAKIYDLNYKHLYKLISTGKQTLQEILNSV